jgi:hypothetical protein
MPNRRVLILSSIFLLILACNLPQANTTPNPQISNTPTVHLPSPTGTRLNATLALPKERPSSTPAYSTVDEFFERCPTAKEITALLADISITLEVDPTRGTLACKESEGSLDLSPLQKRAYQSVLIMKAIRFDTPLPWTDKELYRWFIDTIDGIRFRAGIGNSFCCEPANVINIQVADNSFIFLTDRWIDPAMGGGLMDTMVNFVHEARHNEGYAHTCDCDDNTIAEMGSWGVQYYLFQWLAQHTDPAFFWAPGGDADYYRRIALGNMVSTRKTRFCKEPTVTPGAEPTLAK